MTKKYNYFKNEKGKFECGYCGRDYEYSRGARRHIRNNHDKERLEESQNEKIEKEEKGNKAKVRSKSHRIKTLDQLLEATEVDLDVWEVDHYKVNKWEVGSKHPDTGDIVVEPLFQVKASLKRKVVKKQKFPEIKPVKSSSKLKRKKNKKGDLQTAVIIPDSQNGYLQDQETGYLKPFHNRKCWDLSLQLIEEEQPDKVILLGDMLDLAEWSLKYHRTPEMSSTTQATLVELHWWLSQIRKIVPHAEIIYLEGNHEERLKRAILENMKAAYMLKSADNVEGHAMLSVPNMLGLESIDVKYIGNYPNNEYWITDKLYCCHDEGVSSVPGKTAGNAVKEATATAIFGHSHRLEVASKTIYTRRGNEVHRAISLGCMSNIGGKTPGTKEKQNWQNSIGVVKYNKKMFEVYPLLIQNDRLIWNNKVMEGRERLEDLRKDVNWKQFNIKSEKIGGE